MLLSRRNTQSFTPSGPPAQAGFLPSRLLRNNDGNFEVIDPRSSNLRITDFDIITYTWGPTVQPYDCEIPGVTWKVTISPRKLGDIKRLMREANIQYLWVDCICLNQGDETEMATEVLKMYNYYKSARTCYILMEMTEVWDPQELVNSLKFIDHILQNMGGATLASEAYLTPKLVQDLSWWASTEWVFPMDSSSVRSAGIDMGVLNCYSTCINRVASLFQNPYFTRVWTFQEILLGKNITMYAINEEKISCVGELGMWMDLATDSKDKAYKLQSWITRSRVVRSVSVTTILRVIQEDCLILDVLQTLVKGLNSARTDIISGGPSWWQENHKGVSNIFSAISLRPRECQMRRDIFRGLLGVFPGLFTPEETERELIGDDIEKLSFAFFKQLSNKTGYAWTKLAVSSGERGDCDWIPMVTNHNRLLTTDIFAGVVNLGRLKPKGLVKSFATTGLLGAPKKYMRIQLRLEDRGFQFTFRGCNVGKSIKTGLFSKEPIPAQEQLINVTGDETGRILVHCATILGSLLDPDAHVIEYRRRLLRKLQPFWNVTDPNAKPVDWEDRCVSGTGWGELEPTLFRVHNRSMNVRLGELVECGSRLQNETTSGITCDLRVSCGCTVTAPFSLIFEAITALEGSALGGASATLEDDRIILHDGLGLVQVGDIGREFSLVAMSGDVDSHKRYASICRSTREHKPILEILAWPRGRALVGSEFNHGITDSMRDYGFVRTGGSGNLFICRNVPLAPYKIVGVCIDEHIENKGGQRAVTIR